MLELEIAEEIGYDTASLTDRQKRHIEAVESFMDDNDIVDVAYAVKQVAAAHASSGEDSPLNFNGEEFAGPANESVDQANTTRVETAYAQGVMLECQTILAEMQGRSDIRSAFSEYMTTGALPEDENLAAAVRSLGRASVEPSVNLGYRPRRLNLSLIKPAQKQQRLMQGE